MKHEVSKTDDKKYDFMTKAEWDSVILLSDDFVRVVDTIKGSVSHVVDKPVMVMGMR